jgi:hypothetical protein
VARILDLLRCAESGLFKFELQIVAKIGSALGSTSAAASAEHIPETEDIAEHIAEVGKYAGIESRVSTGSAAQSGVAISIVCCALLGIGKDRIGFGRFLESIFGLFVSRIAIRVILKRELSIRALHFLVCRGFRDAQDFVIVSL